ncbi:MAG: hypothetical protein GY804_00680 [Alphaproteobacteria bacterium]|nr:hypothetical protein [Alphaproteobacteria bacterium]
MSTKSSIFLTKDNEHWYYEHTDDSITIEIDRENIQCDCSDSNDVLLEIKKGCDLWNYLSQLRGHRFEGES